MQQRAKRQLGVVLSCLSVMSLNVHLIFQKWGILRRGGGETRGIWNKKMKGKKQTRDPVPSCTVPRYEREELRKKSRNYYTRNEILRAMIAVVSGRKSIFQTWKR